MSRHVGLLAGAPPANNRSAGSAQGAAARQPSAEYRSGQFLMGGSTRLSESCAPPATRDRTPCQAAGYGGLRAPEASPIRHTGPVRALRIRFLLFFFDFFLPYRPVVSFRTNRRPGGSPVWPPSAI